jgi:transposase-like protein
VGSGDKLPWMTTTISRALAEQTTATQPTATAPAPKSKGRRRRSWTAQEKAQWVARFRESKLGQREFARLRKMSAVNLSRWLRLAPKGRKPAPRREGALVEVPVAAVGSAPCGAEAVKIHLASGVKLEVTPGTDCAWVGQLVGSLQPC